MTLTAPHAHASDEADLEPRFYVHFVPADGDPCSLLDHPISVDEVNPSGNSSTAQYAVILIDQSGPVRGLQFGIEYGPDIEVTEWIPCWPTMEIPTETSPGSGSGMAQSWGHCMNPVDGELFVLGVYEIAAGSWGSFRTTDYTHRSPASIENCERPVGVHEITLSEYHAEGVVHASFLRSMRFARF
jgi:hypothetical protein